MNQTTELGFDRAFPMAPAAPGVVDLIQVYNQYAAQLRMVQSYQRAVVCTSGATAGVDVPLNADLG
jgi:hypothetical protein